MAVEVRRYKNEGSAAASQYVEGGGEERYLRLRAEFESGYRVPYIKYLAVRTEILMTIYQIEGECQEDLQDIRKATK